MTRVLVPLEGMRECRWSQPQFRADARPHEVAEAPWECVREPGQERPITEADCVGCEYWEPDLSLVLPSTSRSRP